MFDLVVDLVDKHVGLDGPQFSEPPRSPSLTHANVMIKNGFFRSFTRCFIFNVERFALMSRTCLKTVCHISQRHEC